MYAGDGQQPGKQPGVPGADEAFTEGFQKVVKDCFLAALLRRNVHDRSPVFRRAVAATQGLLLLAAILFMGGLSLYSLGGRPTPQQQVARRWLEQQYPGVRIRDLKTIQDPPSSVRARFSRVVEEKTVETELVLIVRNSQVVTTFSK